MEEKLRKNREKISKLERGAGDQEHADTRKLTAAIKLLENKSVQIEEEIKTEERTAKENVLKNRTLARRALKRKRRLEKQLKRLDGTMSTLEFQVDTLKNVNKNFAVFNSMKHASEH